MKKAINLLFLLMIVTTSLWSITRPVILSEEEAFNVTATKSADVIAFQIELGEHIYLYADKLSLNITSPIKQSLYSDINLPKGEPYEEFIVLFDDTTILVPISVIKKYVKEGKYTLELSYQGCAKPSGGGICYPPLTYESSYELEASTPSVKKTTQNTQLSEQDKIASDFKDSSVWAILITFFGFGVLLSLTPCIFPMIPILSSIIVSQGENMTTKKSFFLSIIYVLSMSLAYTIAGVLAGVFGSNLQVAFQNPWVISSFSLIFVVLSLSMFGFYNLQLPSFIQSTLTKKSDSMQGHGVVGVAVMGFLSALIVGPCVAAPLAGALIYIGQSGDALLGGAALFMMSLGMGLPLILIGVSAGKFMPRPGVWMDNVKTVFGVVLLGVAIWMLSRIVPGVVTMILLATLLIASAIYMGALEQLDKDSTGWQKLLKSIAVIFLLYGATLFVGAMSGNTNPLKPLENKIIQSSGGVVASKDVNFQKIKTLEELKTAIKNAKKPVMVDFYADWCVNCIELEEFTFSDAKVQQRLSEFLTIKIDVTKNSDEDKKILKYYNLIGPPALIFYNGSVDELKHLRIIGFKGAEAFLKHIKEI